MSAEESYRNNHDQLLQGRDISQESVIALGHLDQHFSFLSRPIKARLDRLAAEKVELEEEGRGDEFEPRILFTLNDRKILDGLDLVIQGIDPEHWVETQALLSQEGLSTSDAAKTLIAYEVAEAQKAKDENPKVQPEVDIANNSLQLLLRDAGRHPLLKPAEEIELAKQIERGDLAAKERMINSNLRLVVANARRYQGQGLALQDLIQEGMLGLVRAVEKFDWRKGFRFSTYATLWIRQAIQRGLENSSRTIRLPVHVAQRSRKVGRIERELTTRIGHEPTDEEIANAADMDLDDVIEIRKADRAVVSLDKPVGEDGEARFGDLLALEAPSVDEEVYEGLKSETLLAAIAELPAKERDVIEMRFGAGDREPQTLAQAGRTLGVSTERARQIEERALKRLSARPEIVAIKHERD